MVRLWDGWKGWLEAWKAGCMVEGGKWQFLKVLCLDGLMVSKDG